MLSRRNNTSSRQAMVNLQTKAKQRRKNNEKMDISAWISRATLGARPICLVLLVLLPTLHEEQANALLHLGRALSPLLYLLRYVVRVPATCNGASMNPAMSVVREAAFWNRRCSRSKSSMSSMGGPRHSVKSREISVPEDESGKGSDIK